MAVKIDQWSDIFAPLIGRILVGGYFLWNGIQTALNLGAASARIAGTTSTPAEFAIFFIFVQVLAGCAVVVGYRTRAAALVLVIYTLLTGVLYTNFADPSQQALLLQSMAVIGGLLYISAYGSGRWSTEGK